MKRTSLNTCCETSFFQDLNLGTKGYPAKCMCLVQNMKNRKNSELWIGSGSLIVIVDPQSNAIKERIQTTHKTNRLISWMTSDGMNNVWTSERGISLVVQWDVVSRTKLFEFQCNNDNPLDHILIETGRSDSNVDEVFGRVDRSQEVGRPEEVVRREEVNRPEEVIADILDLQPKGKSNVDETLRRRSEQLPLTTPPSRFKWRKHSEDKKVILKEVQKLEDTSAYINLDKPQGFVQRSLQKKPSLMYSSTKGKRSSVRKPDKVDSELVNNSVSRPRGTLVSGNPVRVTSLLFVNNALWVGRNNGDILVIAVDEKNVPVGKVLAVLGGQNVRWLGGSDRSITSLLHLPDQHILALVKIVAKPQASQAITSSRKYASSGASEYYQLLKFGAKSVEELIRFNERQVISHVP